MSATFHGISIVNIYAPSGAENRQAFYNIDVVHMIPSSSMAMILSGDFNCVINKDDCTRQWNYSRALARPIWRMELIDVWEATPNRTARTHYTSTGASRIDRIYVNHDLRRKQQGAETVAAAFTDLFAVILRFPMDFPRAFRWKGYWRMNLSFLSDPSFQQIKKGELGKVADTCIFRTE